MCDDCANATVNDYDTEELTCDQICDGCSEYAQVRVCPHCGAKTELICYGLENGVMDYIFRCEKGHTFHGGRMA